MRNLLTAIIALCLFAFSTSVVANNESKQFPKRKYYPQLNYIDTETLAKGLSEDRYNVIDVRDDTSFKALHIKNATNIFIKSSSFEQDILDLVAKDPRPLVIYCNGISCGKSYVASDKLRLLFNRKTIDRQVLTYDAGINAIAHAHNAIVLKNGKNISSDNPLIATDKIREHTLTPRAFENHLTENDPAGIALLDIRDKSEKIIYKLFLTYRQKNITLGKKDKLIAFLNKVKKENKTLMVYDASGRQINGLYELLTITGISNWHYLDGGEYGYSKYAMNSAGL